MFNISKYLKHLPRKAEIDGMIGNQKSKEYVVNKCSTKLNEIMIYAKGHDVPLPLIFSEAKRKLGTKEYDSKDPIDI